jgi:hypothetical protein
MASFSKEIKSNRLLQSRRYTRASLDSQEAFDKVIDLSAEEIYSQANLLPTSSIPYSSSAQDRQLVIGTDGITPVAKYYYRLKLTPDNQGNNSYLALDPPVTNTDASVIQSSQIKNWISNKYTSPAFAGPGNNAETQLPSPTGYSINLTYGATTSSVTNISVNDYQFDYKTGVVQFLTSPPGTPVYMSGYVYIGRTLASDPTLGYSGSFSGSFQGNATLNNLELTGSFNHTGSYNLTGSIDVVGPIISNGINVVDNAIAMAIALG